MHSYDQQNESPYLAVSRLICEKKINDKKSRVPLVIIAHTTQASMYARICTHKIHTYKAQQG